MEPNEKLAAYAKDVVGAGVVGVLPEDCEDALSDDFGPEDVAVAIAKVIIYLTHTRPGA